MRPGKALLLCVSLVLAPALAQTPARELRGTLPQLLTALRPEVVQGVILVGLPGDEALWASLYPYAQEGRATVLTVVCPARRLASPALLRLEGKGQGYLALLRGKTEGYLLTASSPLEARGVVLPASSFPYLARQLNLTFALESPERYLPRCP